MEQISEKLAKQIYDVVSSYCNSHIANCKKINMSCSECFINALIKAKIVYQNNFKEDTKFHFLQEDDGEY